MSNKPAASETDEWWENVQVEGLTLQCQLETVAFASVMNTIQLQQIAPLATIKPTVKQPARNNTNRYSKS